SLIDATVVNLRRHGQVGVARSNAELEFGYRHSDIHRGELVVEARFQLETVARAAAEARIAEIVQWRRENQPGGQNAGSVFTNPDGDSAGRIIDAAGLRGFRVGTA